MPVFSECSYGFIINGIKPCALRYLDYMWLHHSVL